jgi:PST family polysaccharide transporter
MWKRIAPYAAWMWATNLLSNLIEVSDRYMLLYWSSSSPEISQASVGQYHCGRVVPLVLVSIAAMLAGVLIPYLSQAWESNNKAKAKKQLNWSFKLISVCFTAAGIGILFTAPLLFDWVLQGRYSEGLAILPMTLVYCIWFGLMTVAQDYLWVAEKGKWATMVSGIGLLVNIIVNLILIPIIGLPGAVIGTACGNGVLVALMILMNHRFGCHMNIGIWICSLLPLILLTSPLVASGLLIAIGLVCLFTNLILNDEEKQDFQKVYRIAANRLTSSRGS